MTQELLTSILGTIVRNALTPVATYLIARGWLTSDNSTELISAIIVTVAALLWGLYQKYAANKLLKAALISPAGTSLEQAKEVVRETK